MFDIKSYLRDKNISFISSGTNVTKNHVEINCPFCDDPSYHCGIHLTKEVFNCWRCTAKGVIEKLIRKIEKKYSIKNIVSKYKIEIEEISLPKINNVKLIIPSEFSINFHQSHISYLTNRNFNSSYIIKKYSLMCTNYLGKLKFRIIAPVFLNNVMVNYIARSISDKTKKRYEVCPNEQAVIPLNKCLYNIDNVFSDEIIITEGITDVWRIGDGAIATFGNHVTNEQIKLLLSRNLSKAVIFFDNDASAKKQAEILAFKIKPFINTVEILDFEENSSFLDPAEMKEEDIKTLRSEIFSNG